PGQFVSSQDAKKAVGILEVEPVFAQTFHVGIWIGSLNFFYRESGFIQEDGFLFFGFIFLDDRVVGIEIGVFGRINFVDRLAFSREKLQRIQVVQVLSSDY